MSLTSMWSLLAGDAGLASIGQQAFVGVGGHTLFTLTAFAGVPPLLGMALAMLAAGVLAAGVMIKAPNGLWDLLRERLGPDLFPVERRLVVRPEKADIRRRRSRSEAVVETCIERSADTAPPQTRRSTP